MPESWWVILRDSARWFVGRCTEQETKLAEVDGTSGTPADTANRIVAQLATLGYSGEAMLFGLDSAACLTHTIELDETMTARDREAMTFALEAWLPLSAEELVADFVVSGRHALGIAVETNLVSEFVRELESRGVVIQSITPTALLALQEYLRHRSEPAPELVLWGNGDHIDLFQLTAGHLRDWRLLSSASPSVTRELEVLALNEQHRFRVVALDVADGLRDSLAALEHVSLIETRDILQAANTGPHEPTPGDEMDIGIAGASADAIGAVVSQGMAANAATAAKALLAGEQAPWVEFRRGPLAAADPHRPIRGAIRFATTAAAVMLVVLSTACFVRLLRYEAVVDRSLAEQTDLFQTTLPGQPIPVGIRSRLESEYAKLAGMTGQTSDVPILQSALTSLHHVLAAIPSDLRCRVIELRLESGRVYLESEVLTYGESDRLAASLRQEGFQVESPQSELLPQGTVAVRIHGTPHGNTSKTLGATP